ncbi:MAG: RagB/SusD family nutrient uptake outer membrane protein, partial [Lewinellaceae bacterium]|nr:RagB/SusD family nutrient uptake outer membrane protein [Lewinellaceae bacterium]
AWGGFATLAEFYHSFGPGDPRFLGPRITVANANLGFNAGYQLDNHGDTILLFDGAPLYYAVDIDPDGASRQQGARPVKYEPAAAPGGIAPDNLWVALRLGEVYLMRAEAAFRKGSESEALEILNELREKRGAAQLSAVNEDSIMAEYGFELWWEGHRRTQLIRFGKFNRELSIRPTGSEAFYQLFPIPQKALDANPALRQNPGY